MPPPDRFCMGGGGGILSKHAHPDWFVYIIHDARMVGMTSSIPTQFLETSCGYATKYK